ncbi:MAG TPA: YhdP family protein, partial [Burkholderiales bacterium]|nr:YhdP family protein [Burkholderiales bacterium]
MNDKPTPLAESLHEMGDALSAAGSAAVQFEQAAERAVEKELRRHPRWRVALSVLGWLLVALYFAFAVMFLSLRYWVLPHIGQYTPLLESSLSRLIGEKVTIGSIHAGWQGLRPELDMTQLEIRDREGRVAFSLPVVEAVVSWSSVVFGSIHFHSLAFQGPDLDIRRDAQGALYIAGMPVKESRAGGPDFSNWLLAQNEVVIRDARLSWTDEKRAAGPLNLSGVNFVMRNRGDQHRFAIRAQTARELASALDVRGDFRGDSLARLDQWSGELYSELDYTDLAAWQRWVHYPFELRSGAGGIRLWLGVSDGRPTSFTADVALSGVAARLAPELPLLELGYVHGRLGARNSPKATEIFGKALALSDTRGLAMQPADFTLRVEPGLPLPGLTPPGADAAPPAAATADRARTGRLTATSLQLQPLVQLAEYLPFPEALRKRLGEADPRGTVRELALDWSGEVDHPATYRLTATLDALALRPNGGLPGFAGLTGKVEASEKGGALALGMAGGMLELPGVLPADKLAFDSLSGKVSWSMLGEQMQFKTANLAFANADLAGTATAEYSTKPGSPGVIDLSAHLSRADGRAVTRYIPQLRQDAREYLDSAIVSGGSNAVTVRLKGDLARFPFADDKAGTFQIAAHVNDGEFAYAPDWPRASGIVGDLIFEGRGMRVNVQRALIHGLRVTNARAVIPDLYGSGHVLTVEGQADGPTQDFLRFIDDSPLAHALDGATESFQAAGNGRLQLRLDVPLANVHAVRVNGSYLVQNNQLALDPDLPPIAQLSGRLNFTETSFTARGFTGQFLGGPISVAAQTQGDGAVTINAQGSATMAALRRYLDSPLAAHAGGSAPWRANAVFKKRLFDFTLESNLQGVAIDLPAPLGKSAADIMPLRIERGSGADSEVQKRFGSPRLAPRGDTLLVSLGKAVNAVLLRRNEGGALQFDRGNIALNAEPALPERSGMTLSGSLPYLDVDRWQTLLSEPTAPGAVSSSAPGSASSTAVASGPAAPQPGNVSAINLKVATLDVAGKRLNDVTARLNAGAGGQWSGNVSTRELSGDVAWRPEGRGRMQARLKQFTIPDDRPAPPGAARPEAQAVARELPGLDITAEEFILHER